MNFIKEFESYAKTKGRPIDKDENGDYIHSGTQYDFETWREALRILNQKNDKN